MKQKMDFSLVLATYNEETHFENSIKHILDTLDHSLLKYEIIFVDDCSMDNTRRLIKKICEKHSDKCSVILNAVNRGRGATVTEGFLSASGEVIGYIDIDCEISPIYMPEAVRLILNNQGDVVLGKRIYLSNLKSIFRAVMSVSYKKIANLFLDTGNMDTESGYKFFNKRKILPLLKYADHPHWFWDTQIMVISRKKGLKIIEIPVLFIRDEGKKSTIKIFKDSVDYLKNLVIFSERIKDI